MGASPPPPARQRGEAQVEKHARTMPASSHDPGAVTSKGQSERADEATGRLPRRRVLSNMGAHLGGVYGSKVLDFILLAVVSRKLSMAEVGTYFLALAAGGMVFRLVDLGLYPVLQRRAARGEASRELLAWATRARVLALLGLTVGFAVIACLRYPGEWLLASAFFFSSGTYQVHEISRAILAGRERFALTARLGVATKAVEVSLSAPLVWAGLGVWPWAIGRMVSQIVLLGLLYRALSAELPARGAPPPRTVIREGLPFWLTSLFQSVVFRVDTLVVGAYLGLAEAAHLGIAGRLVGGAMSVVSSLLIVTYPALARERRRFITPREATVVIGLSSLLGAATFVAAPLAVRVITGRWEEGPTEITRALVPVIVLTAISQALESWLQSKNRERALAVLAVVTGTIATALLVYLVRAEGTLGAALARDARATLEAVVVGAYALAVLSGVRAPVPWVLSRLLPLGPALVRRLTRRRVSDLVTELARVPAVASVAIGGSGRPGEESRHRPGISDLDLLVGTRGPLTELPEAILRVEALLEAGTWLGRAQALVVDQRLLTRARGLGHPILSAPHTPLWGEPFAPEPDPRSARPWALSQAIERFMHLQRVAKEESRHDGGARASAVAKELRHIVSHLVIAVGTGPWLDTLRAGVPGDVVPGEAPRRLWLRPEEVAAVLIEAHRALGAACEEQVRTWPVEEAGVGASASLEEKQRRLDLAGGLRATLRPLETLGAPIELTPRSPVGEGILLTLSGDVLDRAGWLRFLGVSSTLKAGTARHATSPVVLPSATLRAAAFIQRTPLVCLGRRSGALAVFGPLTPLAVPDPTFLREAARREIVHACIRIPTDVAWLRRAPGGKPSRAAERLAGFAETRVRAYLDGRLVLLRLLADGALPSRDPREIASAYAARYGSSPLSAVLSGGVPPGPGTIEPLLLQWVSDVTSDAERSIVPPGISG